MIQGMWRIDADVVHIAASVSGRIVRLAVGENELVKAGDVLFEIDPEPYRLRVELASTELQSAQALLDLQRRTVATETSNMHMLESCISIFLRCWRVTAIKKRQQDTTNQ